MMEKAIRPCPGENVILVLLSRTGAAVLNAKVLLDRGKGLVVEVIGEPSWTQGQWLIMLFTFNESLYILRGRLMEILTPTRCYILPTGTPVEMEKREFIRASLTLPISLEPCDAQGGEMIPREIELSASGFRMAGGEGLVPGKKVVLRLRDDGGKVIVLPAEIVRQNATEVAGKFTDITAEDRDAILRLVFTARYREVGLEGEPVP